MQKASPALDNPENQERNCVTKHPAAGYTEYGADISIEPAVIHER